MSFASMNSRQRSTSSAWPVYLLILLAPLEVYGVDVGADTIVTPVFAAAILMLPLLIVHVASGRARLSHSPATVLLALFTATSLITVPTTVDPTASFVSWGVSATMLLLYLYASAYLTSGAMLERAITCFIAIGVVVMAMGGVEFVGYVFFGRQIKPPFALRPYQVGSYGFGGGLMRMHGFFTASNKIGSFLLLPFGLAFYRRNIAPVASLGRRAYSTLAAVFAGGILLSLAGNAVAALVTFLAVRSVIRWKRHPARDVSLVLATVLLTVGLALVNPTTGIGFIDRLNPLASSAQVEGGAVYDAALFASHARTSAIAGFENFGLGRGFQNYDDWAYNSGQVLEWGSHSNFLQFLGENGIIGFALQVMVVVWVLRRARARLRETKGGDELALCLVCVFSGLVVCGIVRTYYYTEHVWLLLGVTVSYLQPASLAHARPTFAATGAGARVRDGRGTPVTFRV